MAFHYSPKVPSDGLCFAWDGMNPKSWTGSQLDNHYDLVSGTAATKQGANSIQYGVATPQSGTHVRFYGGGNRVAYLSFPSANITVPTGDAGTWLFTSYFIDSGNFDHPNIGKETGGGWDGANGFVFGTGWGTDGPRWGVAGTGHTVYANESISDANYRPNVWQIYGITYERNSSTGLKTYLLDSNGGRLCDQRATSNVAIGSNSNALHIGATNSRGGNWNGYMDSVYMWTRALSADEILTAMDNLHTRFAL
jgi:hypothetical protein